RAFRSQPLAGPRVRRPRRTCGSDMREVYKTLYTVLENSSRPCANPLRQRSEMKRSVHRGLELGSEISDGSDAFFSRRARRRGRHDGAPRPPEWQSLGAM